MLITFLSYYKKPILALYERAKSYRKFLSQNHINKTDALHKKTCTTWHHNYMINLAIIKNCNYSFIPLNNSINGHIDGH